MQLAVDVAGFDAGEADQLRRAMGSKRSTEKMEKLRGGCTTGWPLHGITGELADRIFDKLLAFANFGFPESHAMCFASLVFYIAWLKLHHPAAFCAALLRAQPMGFYSPQSLVADARRHGVTVRRPGRQRACRALSARSYERPGPRTAGRRPGGPARAGRGAHDRDDLAEQIVAERDRAGPYRDLADLARRGDAHRRRPRRWPPRARSTASGRSPAGGAVGGGRGGAVRAGQLPGTAVGLDARHCPG